MSAKKDLYVYLKDKVIPNFSCNHKSIDPDEIKELFNKYEKWKGQSEFNLFSLTNIYYKNKILNQKKSKYNSSRNNHVKNKKMQKNLKKNSFPTSLFSSPSSYLTDRIDITQKNITHPNYKSKYSKTQLKNHLEFNNPVIDYISKIISSKSINVYNPSSKSKQKKLKRPATSSYRSKNINIKNYSKNKINFRDFTYEKFNTIIKQPQISKKVPKKFFLYDQDDELDLYLGGRIIDENNSKLILRGLALDKNRKAYYEKCQQMSVFKDGKGQSIYSEDKKDITSEVSKSNNNVHIINNLNTNLSSDMNNNDNRAIKKKKNLYLGIKYENKDNKFMYSLKGLVNNTQPILINPHK